MLQASRTILRHRNCLLSRVSVPSSSQPLAAAQCCRRSFAAEAMPASNVPCPENHVKDAIKKMMLEREQEEDNRPIGDQELRDRFQSFQNLYKEAQLCIADCEDAADNFEEEEQVAKSAVMNVYNEYVELLEDLRHASEEQLQSYNDARLENASNVKLLVQELEKIRRNP